jgi:hypothetical protein
LRDVDDEVDIDGDDEEVFGNAQFTEGDIIGPHSNPPADVEPGLGVEVNGHDETLTESKTLKDLVAEGRTTGIRTPPGNSADEVRARMDEVMGEVNQAITVARKQGNPGTLITALENKVKQLVRCSLLFEPTVE